MRTSLWQQSPHPRPRGLDVLPDGRFDVAVVGAGLTGACTALLLARAGLSVVLLDQHDVGAGSTGRSTAKVSVLQGTRLSTIRDRHGDERARAYHLGNVTGQQWLLAEARRLGVPVHERRAATFAHTAAEIPAVEAEFAAHSALGTGAHWLDARDVPYAEYASVVLPGQAQVDPQRLVDALVTDAQQHGVVLLTGTRLVALDASAGRLTVARTTAHGAHGDDVPPARAILEAERVVLATGIPVLDRGGFFGRFTPERSYAAALRVPDGWPTPAAAVLDMSLNAGSPGRSVRDVPAPDVASPDGLTPDATTDAQDPLVLVGGSGHVVGRADSEAAHLEDLVRWGRATWPGAEVVAAWSAQDYHPTDELPDVGPLLPSGDRVFVGTGYAKWGLTNAPAAALILAARLTGADRPDWADAFQAWGSTLVAGAAATLKANAEVVGHLVGDRVARVGQSGDDDAAPEVAAAEHADAATPVEGEGRVVGGAVRPVGVSTVDGRTCAVSATCPHLGGLLSWNDAERTWDCPLHGSRFAPDGALLEGPAVDDLAQQPVPGAPAT